MPFTLQYGARLTLLPDPLAPVAALTASVQVKVCVISPEVPVMVTAENPAAASAVAANASVCVLPVPVTEPVTPLGKADRLKLTSPLKTPKSAILMVAFADPFSFR